MDVYHEIYHKELKWMELLRMALRIFSEIFGSFAKIWIMLFLPVALLESVIVGRMNQAMEYVLQFTVPVAKYAGMGMEELQQITEAMAHVLSQELLLYAVVLFLQPVGMIAIAKAVKQHIDGVQVQVSKCIFDALGCMPAILISGILFGVLTFLGSLVIVPGVYFSIAWSLYYYCIALEGKSGWEALQGSKVLVQGKWWRTFGYLCLIGFVGAAWNYVFQLVCTLIGHTGIAGYLYSFLCYISVGFTAVGECLLYLNRKAVAEGMQPAAVLEQKAEIVEENAEKSQEKLPEEMEEKEHNEKDTSI